MAKKPVSADEPVKEEAQEEVSDTGELINIGGLWLQKNKEGQPFFTGYLNGARLLIFKNGYKKSDKHPDYVMYVGKHQKKEDKGSDDLIF